MTTGRAWLALVPERPPGATAAAEVRGLETGEALGWLAAWLQAEKPVRHALRADPAAFDADGPAGVASYVLIPPERAVLFDDPAIQQARRRLLEGGPWTAVTTLNGDSVHFKGSLLGAQQPARFDDPFTHVAPGRRLSVSAGLLSAGPPRLPSPVIERYAGKPWPQSGF